MSTPRAETSKCCYECGLSFPDYTQLQKHLEDKLAFSSKALVGCSVVIMFESESNKSCTLDPQTVWKKGYITKYDSTTNRHVILLSGEEHELTQDKMGLKNLSLVMKNYLFCIKERPPNYFESLTQESEENIHKPSYDFAYVKTQSLLARVYGNQETGYSTLGHRLISALDQHSADEACTSLLYGEILPAGVNKALNNSHLEANECKSLLELGSGLGKLALQAFYQYPNINRLVGVEFSVGRYRQAQRALQRLAAMYPTECKFFSCMDRQICCLEQFTSDPLLGEEKHGAHTIEGRIGTRTIHFERFDFFQLERSKIHDADIIIMEADIPQQKHKTLFSLLSAMKCGARLLSYIDLRTAWSAQGEFYGPLPFLQLPINKSPADRFPTTWSPERGHHFFLWRKL